MSTDKKASVLQSRHSDVSSALGLTTTASKSGHEESPSFASRGSRWISRLLKGNSTKSEMKGKERV